MSIQRLADYKNNVEREAFINQWLGKGSGLITVSELANITMSAHMMLLVGTSTASVKDMCTDSAWAYNKASIELLEATGHKASFQCDENNRSAAA